MNTPSIAALIGALLLLPSVEVRGSAGAELLDPYKVSLTNGVEVWVAPHEYGHLACVRLEADVGVVDEDPGNYGMGAALAAVLLRGATGSLAAGEAEKRGLEAGLRPFVELDARATALTLCGPPNALELALWLTGERLAGMKADKASFPLIRTALWFGARGTRYDAVSVSGDPLDTAAVQALGPRDGNNAFVSRMNASRYDALGFERRFLRAWSRARFRVVLAGPARDMPKDQVERWVRQNLGPLAPRNPVSARRPQSPPGRIQRRSRMRHSRDGAYLYATAWDLRGVDKLTGFSRVKNDAVSLTLHQLLDQQGGLLEQALVDNHQLARRVATRLSTDENAFFAVEVELRARDSRDAAQLLAEEVGRLTRVPLTKAEVDATAAAVAVQLLSRWQHARARAALVSAIVATGRSTDQKGPALWLRGLLAELSGVRPRDLMTFSGFAFSAERQVALNILPSRPARQEVELTEAIIERYRQIVTDVRCRTWDAPPPLRVLLERKYGYSARKYVEITRGLTRQRPGLMRRMIRDADLVCGQWKRLAEIIGSRRRAIELHRAVACGSGSEAKEAKRERALKKIFRRFDIDPSVYRPLLNMLRADVKAMEAVAAIDAQCRPKHGPAAL